ncbi:hypothetical protein BJ138DRAFT_1175188 [Hygrophoropsis aurantiaca]|uniref:Uncharacterized protein n=1 Tax=Hygrophoropsis aurantiaca TaxID=72124 RepID=A0ACB7ZXJ1_9AGAM|nr:hypothetical protein BJ138DRAFT_1175188 [Hygrophoropsis aurantiaca]
MSKFQQPLRKVYLPLNDLDKCAICEKDDSLRLCSSCGERIYCSSECQTKDWPSHKLSCGKTDRVDLNNFYPILAILVEQCHMHAEKPMHSALLHTVVNKPNPNALPSLLPDGSSAKVVILGDKIPLNQVGSRDWWPGALTDKVRGKLSRRFIREGYILPILTSISLGLLSEMYTTTSGARSTEKRIRLKYHSHPISDFGIACGSTRVTPQDKLAYYNLNDETFTMGQDPDEHYWLYFSTMNGKEFTLDCGMYTFNMCYMLVTQGYLPPGEAFHFPFAPAFFRDKILQKNTPELHRERKRFSVLRDPELQAAVAHTQEGLSPADLSRIWAFVKRVSGRECTDTEKHLLGTYTLLSCTKIGEVLTSDRWKEFPATPTTAIEGDPGELDDLDDGSEQWWDYLQKWKKLKRQGKLNDQTEKEAYLNWQREHEASKKANKKKGRG